MAVSLKLKNTFSCLKYLLQQRRFCHTYIEGRLEADLVTELGPKTMVAPGPVDTSKWQKVDSRTVGLTPSLISDSSRIVVRILQNEGYDAYLVGGCVRDLLLHKVPKDFDVVTTANLQEIKQKFHRAFIVGRRFPICRVLVRGSVIEVSSFETVSRNAKEKEDIQLFDIPKGYGEKDLLRWKNSLHRDFTINSLFYDPFAHKIYDYSSGMADLTSLKLRTLVPAQLSFQEDCARILRGLRIAARLGLSFAKDTEKALFNLSASVTTLDKARLMMEMNYMLSYGAAEPSLLLLKRFKLLEVLLPFHAAYLIDHSGARSPVMLMKLFFNLDTIVSCEQPCDSSLWVSLLAFHLALVNNPQDALVVWTFCSVLYHGQWKKGVNAARVLAKEQVNFVPEILESINDVTDEELAESIASFASIVLDSIDALTDSERLKKVMDRYPSSPCSGLVFISKNASNEATKIFNVMVNDIKSLSNEGHYYEIDYKLLGKGDVKETRFVLGKVIMDTMMGGVAHNQTKLVTHKSDHINGLKPKAVQVVEEKPISTVSKNKDKRGLNAPDDQLHQHSRKKQKNSTPSALLMKLVTEKVEKFPYGRHIAKKKQQLKKVVVKDVNKFLSLQKEVVEGDAKLALGKQKEAQSFKKMGKVMGNASKIAKQVQRPKAKTGLLEKAPKSTKQHKPGVLLLNELRQSNRSKGEQDLAKKDDKPKKEEMPGEKPSRITKKLLSIFK